MLDVHPPHAAVHGWRDFLLHLLTITIGLLIALSLEGLVEWQHHRHLVHEAEASLHAEIQHNADFLQARLADVEKQQATLKQDVVVLKGLMQKPQQKHGSMEIGFHIAGFDSVSWKTAQNTGALAYMSYDRAKEYSQIYSTQDALYEAEQVGARDAIISLAPLMNSGKDDPDPSAAEANEIKGKIEVLQGQLTLIDALMKSLEESYKKFLSAHPE